VKWLSLNMPNKAALRKQYRAKRQALSSKELAAASAQILKQLIAQNLVTDGLLMLYFDSPLHGELPMRNWFEHFENHPICVPKVVDANGHMEAVLWTKKTPLTPNEWGILEPKSNAFISPKNIETIIVPLLCFDQHGHRVGYGKGYYDRFLARCAKNVKTIGVSAFDVVETIEDANEKDYLLDIAVTPKKVYLF